VPRATIDNATPYVVGEAFLADEEGRLLYVPIVKASFDIVERKGLVRSEQQRPIDAVGKRWDMGDQASYRNEPECAAFFKPATDVVLVGHAIATEPGTTEMTVELRLGPLRKRVRVVGDRSWRSTADGPSIGAAAPFERIALAYERALGGWDRSDPDPAKHAIEPRNPVGVGFRAPGASFVEGPLPNIEDPEHPLSQYAPSPSPPPAGVGFLSPGWAPRVGYAGSYGQAWLEESMPLLPRDFDRRFFNAASPGLVADGYLAGDEEACIEGVSARGPLAFKLPGIAPPSCRVGRRRLPDSRVELLLDTLVIDSDARQVTMLWRGHLALRESPHEVRWMAIG